MSPHPFDLRPLIALVAMAPVANALQVPDALQRIPVTVIAQDGFLLTINRGLNSGLKRGDSVVFPRSARPPLVGVLRRVDRNHSQVELENDEGLGPLAVGLQGDVLVPRQRAVADGNQTDVPAHPPWKEPVGPWASGKPLLAPVKSPTPEERPSEIYGRIYTRYQSTDDALRGSKSSRWWSGVSFDWKNPFDKGGQLRFKGDTSYRDQDGGSTQSDPSSARVQRFSYAYGTAFDDPLRVEAGRFLPQLLPQFGLTDGAQVLKRTKDGHQFGASLGFLPDPRDDLAPSDNLSVGLYGRWISDPQETVSLNLGYQKTWHEGQADRDLLASTLQWLIGKDTSLRGSLLADYYDSSEQIESSGLQVTELHVSLDHRFGTSGGASLYASYFDWPELLRDQFGESFEAATVLDQQVSRAGISGWTQLRKGVNLYGRFDGWTDDQFSGTFADLRLDLRDLLYDASELSLGLYDTQGSFSGGLGARVRHTHWIGAASLRLGYETVQFKQDGFLGAQSTLLQHLLRLNLDTKLASDLDLSAEALQRFGDEQDSLTLGLRLTWRF